MVCWTVNVQLQGQMVKLNRSFALVCLSHVTRPDGNAHVCIHRRFPNSLQEADSTFKQTNGHPWDRGS